MLGDALAMAAWVQMFWDGIIVDPHEIFGQCSDEVLASVVREFPKGCGPRRIVVAEQCFRIGALAGPWSWSVTGIGRAEIALQFAGEVDFLHLDIWARRAA